MTASPRRPRRDAVANRGRLLAAAEAVFARSGPQAGVTDVAAEAGVGVGTLYRHFGTKESLVDALVDQLVADLRGAVRIAEQREADRPGTGFEDYLALVGECLQRHRSCLSRLWERPASAGLDDERAAVDALLAAAQASGRVRAELTRSDVAVVLWSLRAAVVATAPVSTTAWRRHLEVLVAGLRPATALATPPLSDAELAAAERRRRA